MIEELRQLSSWPHVPHFLRNWTLTPSCPVRIAPLTDTTRFGRAGGSAPRRVRLRSDRPEPWGAGTPTGLGGGSVPGAAGAGGGAANRFLTRAAGTFC